MLLTAHVKSLGRMYSIAQKNDLMERRRKLEARITNYEHRMSLIMKLDDDTMWSKRQGKDSDVDPDIGDLPYDLSELYPDGWFTPEGDQITLPSALAPGEIERLAFQSIATIEFELRKGQVTDALDGLRLALGEKSLCFRTEVRNANSQRTTSRTWDNVHKLDTEARKLQSTYRTARNALQRLNIDPEYLETLRDITDDELKVAGDITDDQRFGQRSDALPWFWRIGEPVGSSGPRMQECTCATIPLSFRTHEAVVYRVSWLRAKARFSRWSEELRLVGYEMQWTVNWFRWKEREWRERLANVTNEDRPPGLDCYCHKQIWLWQTLGDQAHKRFSHVLGRPLFE